MLQLIVTVPEEDMADPRVSGKGEYSVPPSKQMPGTIKYRRRYAVHMSTDKTYEEFLADLPEGWAEVAAQAFSLTYDYNDDGDIVGGPYGVIVPVSETFTNYLPDHVEYDDDGNDISRISAQPGQPLHTFAGADQWVWAPKGLRDKIDYG